MSLLRSRPWLFSAFAMAEVMACTSEASEASSWKSLRPYPNWASLIAAEIVDLLKKAHLFFGKQSSDDRIKST